MALDFEHFKRGFDLTIKNAENLRKMSIMSAKSNEFGIACSLNILSAEEAIKAVFLVLKCNYPESEIDEFDKIFRNHKIKHDYKKISNIK